MQKTILTYNSLLEFETAACNEIVRCIQSTLAEREVCHCALTGGKTPEPIYRMLGGDPYKSQIEWKRVHLYFGDERMVPPTDAESNYGMAHRTLISHVPIPADHVHRIHGEMRPHDAAAMYAREIVTFNPAQIFDLMLLGMGANGHTASLFPGSEVLDAKEEPVRAVYVPQIGAWRVTMTLPIINRSREILFIISGKEKAPALARLRTIAAPSKQLPSSLVRTETGTLLIMCDPEAAGAPAGTIG